MATKVTGWTFTVGDTEISHLLALGPAGARILRVTKIILDGVERQDISWDTPFLDAQIARKRLADWKKEKSTEGASLRPVRDGARTIAMADNALQPLTDAALSLEQAWRYESEGGLRRELSYSSDLYGKHIVRFNSVGKEAAVAYAFNSRAEALVYLGEQLDGLRSRGRQLTGPLTGFMARSTEMMTPPMLTVAGGGTQLTPVLF